MNIYNMKYLLLVLQISELQIFLAGKKCRESIPTVRDVPMCPRNEEEWRSAAKRKGCDAIAKIQKCSPVVESFVYHCLVNSWENGTVELCAPKWFLAGYCGNYNLLKGKIFNNVNKDCTQFQKPCPTRYNSSDSYKYQECYRIDNVTLAEREESGKEIEGSEHEKEELDKEGNCSTQCILAGLIFANVVWILFIIVLVKKVLSLKKKKKAGNTKEDQNEKNKGSKTSLLKEAGKNEGNTKQDQGETKKSSDIQTFQKEEKNEGNTKQDQGETKKSSETQTFKKEEENEGNTKQDQDENNNGPGKSLLKEEEKNEGNTKQDQDETNKGSKAPTFNAEKKSEGYTSENLQKTHEGSETPLLQEGISIVSHPIGHTTEDLQEINQGSETPLLQDKNKEGETVGIHRNLNYRNEKDPNKQRNKAFRRKSEKSEKDKNSTTFFTQEDC